MILFTNVALNLNAQNFAIKIASFSSQENDEFSPVYYKGGIVFCSNKTDNSVISYKNDQKGLFKMFYVEKKDSAKWRHAKILAKEISSSFNDGPATFNENGNIIYYSRNNLIHSSLKNINNASNKIGIYSAELINGKWQNIKPFKYNNPLYSFGTPALAPNGERIYFSSDMPDGFGGMDLYYCDRIDNEWYKPVNMGSFVNTAKNESFPFTNKNDKLFFASDGHNGFGGKDLYYTMEINGKWTASVHLDSSINSSADEFGLVTDSIFENGYFSTNRLNTDDIFNFRSLTMKFVSCDTLKENHYCFTLYDEQYQQNDTTDVGYTWDFGNGVKRYGKEVKHCFPGPGKYMVKLSITDNLTGNMIVDHVDYDVELDDIEQAYINSFDIAIVGNPIVFNGLKSNLKDFQTKAYFWNFGNSFILGKPSEIKTFGKKGVYEIQLGIAGKTDSAGIFPKSCVKKKINVYDNYQKLKFNDENTQNINDNSLSELLETLQVRIYFMDDLSELQMVKIKESVKSFGKLKLTFNKYGITTASYPFLNKVAEILKVNADIRLEMYVHTSNNVLPDNILEISERWAQELSFYLKNKEIVSEAYHCKGFGFSSPVFEPFINDNHSINGVVDVIFRNNQ